MSTTTTGVCTPAIPGSICRITKVLTVSLQETAGRDVALQSLSGVLFDTRALADVHAEPAALSAENVRAAAGSSVVPGRGRLDVPYTLTYEIVQPSIQGPIKAMVRAQGRDSGGNGVAANAEAF